MPKYLIRESHKGGLTFYDSYERLVDGVKIVAQREENNDFAEVAVVFPDNGKLPDEDDDLTLNDYEHDIQSVTGDIEAYWYISGDLDEGKKAELLEELEANNNADEMWSHIEGSDVVVFQGGYEIVEKL